MHIINPRVSSVREAISVNSDPVHPHHIGQVLNGAGGQEPHPVQSAGRWPVGHIENRIIVPLVSGKDREPKVVADLEKEAPPAPRGDHPLRASVERRVLAGHPKEVALVINRNRALGCDEESPIEVPIAVLDNDAAEQGGPELSRTILHPRKGRAVRGLRQRLAPKRKSGGEHLG